MERTKELTNVPEVEGTVVIKKLGYGSLSKLRSKTTNTRLDQKTSSVDASMDMGEYSKWLLVYGIESAPFYPSNATFEQRANIIDKDEISSQTGDYLFKQIQIFNNFEGMDDLKKK